MRRLPPFPELVAFEAVARLRSFTLAANELCLTQSAISHRIRRLEEHFGTSLVRRLNPGLELTAEGAAVLSRLTVTLDELEQLHATKGRRLRVVAGNALCAWWLAGRLPRFMAARPDVSVELIPVDPASSAIPYADVRILWLESGRGSDNANQQPLFIESVFPVCKPSLLPGGKPLEDVQHLRALPLLHKGTSEQLSAEWSWPVWLERLSITGVPQRAAELRFADMSIAMSAAVDGAGVALTRSLLAHDALASGRLVPALAHVEPVASSKEHVARWPSALADDPEVHAFVRWLAAESEVTLAATDALLARRNGVSALGRRGAASSSRPEQSSELGEKML